MCKISVVMPAFKSSFLSEAVESILRQTFKDFELVIVDDCSPEDLKLIVDSFSDSRIKYHRNDENVGGKSLVDQWNHCLQYANNELFVLASDDDIYEPTFLEKLYSLTEKYPRTNVFHSRVAVINRDGELIMSTPTCAEWESSLTFIWSRICNDRQQYIPEFMFRTSALRESGGFVNFPSAWGSDHATTFLLSQKGGAVCCNEALFKWRLSGLNISSEGNFSEKKLDAIFMYLSWVKNLLEEGDFERDTELLPLIYKGLSRYKERRIPTLLKSMSFRELFRSMIRKGHNGHFLDRKWIAKSLLLKISK